MSNLTTDPQYLEMVMAKALLEDKDFVVTVIQVYEETYFDSPDTKELFKFVKQYFGEFKEIPERSIILNSIPIDLRPSLESYLNHIDSIDVNLAQHRDWLLAQTDAYLKDKAIKEAIRSSVDIIDQGHDTHEIRTMVESALCRTINIDLGLNYFGDLGPRLERMCTDDTQRLRTYFPVFDDFINGGFPPKTLSIFVARIHGFKCVSYNSYIYINDNGNTKKIKIGDFYKMFNYEHCLQKNDSIAKESIDIKNRNIRVMSDKGLVPVDYVHKTYSFRKYVILFESGRELECADNHCLINSEYTEIMAKNLSKGDVILSDNGVDIVFDIFDTGEYEEMYDITMKDHHRFYANGILSHNSNVMANMIARQVLNGKNIALASLEMSEDMFAQRFDGIYSLLDINRFYFNRRMQAELIQKLREIKQSPGRGNLFIKSFPTGKASAKDFRIWVRELSMRGIKLDAFYFDYLNLMSSTEVAKSDNTYSSVKSVAEETRAMGFEFDMPMISVSQLNRAGTFMNFDEVDFNSIAECIHVDSVVNKKIGNSYVDTKIKDINVGDDIMGAVGDVEVINKFPVKKKKVYRITTESGKTIICSDKHKFPTNNGEKSIITGLSTEDKLNSK